MNEDIGNDRMCILTCAHLRSMTSELFTTYQSSGVTCDQSRPIIVTFYTVNCGQIVVPKQNSLRPYTGPTVRRQGRNLGML